MATDITRPQSTNSLHKHRQKTHPSRVGFLCLFSTRAHIPFISFRHSYSIAMSNHHQRHILYLPQYASNLLNPTSHDSALVGMGFLLLIASFMCKLGTGRSYLPCYANRSLAWNPAFDYLHINGAFNAAHIVLSFRFMLRRVRKSQVDPMLELTVGKRQREPVR